MRWARWVLLVLLLTAAGLLVAIRLADDSTASHVTQLYVQVVTAIGTLLAATAAMIAALGSERTAERVAQTAVNAERALALHLPPSAVVFSRLTPGRHRGEILLIFSRSDRELREVTVSRMDRGADAGPVVFRPQPSPFTLRGQDPGQEKQVLLAEVPAGSPSTYRQGHANFRPSNRRHRRSFPFPGMVHRVTCRGLPRRRWATVCDGWCGPWLATGHEVADQTAVPGSEVGQGSRVM
jgi:hypothetical protein